MYRVTVKGLAEFQEVLAKSPEITREEMETGMKKSVITVTNNVKEREPVGVSGHLRKTTGWEVTTPGQKVVGRVGTSITDIYPIIVELGRRPGNPPPSNRLERWVHLKMGVSTAMAPKAAKDLSLRIALNGIKGKFMFKEGFEASVKDIEKYFDDALLAIVRKLGD